MIIEAGHDILQLVSSNLIIKNRRRHHAGLWVIALDGDLRLMHVSEVGAGDAVTLEERIPLVHHALHDHPGEVIYYALAHLDTQLTGNFSREYERQDDLFSSSAELAEHEYLGIILSNGRELYISVPQHDFIRYPLLDHLPRAAFFDGPHTADCECGACEQLEERERQVVDRD